MEQGSPEWFAARCGKVTASRIADVMAKTAKGPSASRDTYMKQLVAERLTNCIEPSYSNAAMQHGTLTEPEARRAYEFLVDCDVEQVGFVPHPTIAWAGASPDGLVGDDGLLEIKCPNTATHVDTLLGATVPGKYIKQIQFQLACTGRQWCDFCSFDNRVPERHRIFVQRINRDEAMIAEIEEAVTAFIAEIDAKLAQLEQPQLEMAA